MSIKIVNGKYQVTFRDHNRKEIQRTFRLKSEADAFLGESKQQLRRGQYFTDSKETVAERADAWLKRKKAADGYRFKTLQNYEIHIDKYIRPELGQLRIQRLTIQDCEEAALLWKARTSANTANMVLKTLNGIFDEAQRHRVIEVNVAEKAERLKITTEDEDDGEIQPEDVYTEEQLAALIGATEAGELERILVWLGGFCGLRIGEILGFSWPAIDLKATSPKVRVIKNLVSEEKEKSDFPGYGNTGRTLKDPKKKSRRTLSAPRELVKDLRLWKLKCPPARPRVWPGMDPLAKQLVMLTVDGQPLQPKAAQNLLDAACDRADVTRRTLHRLRHTFASQLLKMGTSLSDVSHFLGHRDVGITSRSYAHFIDDDSTAVQDMASRVLSHAKAGKKDSE